MLDVTDGIGTEEAIVASYRAPKDPLEMLDHLLEGLTFLSGTSITTKDFDWETHKSLIATDRAQNVASVVTMGKEVGYLSTPSNLGNAPITILPKGWERLRELRTKSVNTKKAFVALQFSSDMIGVYDRVYAPVLTATGFEPAQTVHPTHNDKIDDFIIAEIRKSGLFIADFTGHRPNVYFEAGFAMG